MDKDLIKQIKEEIPLCNGVQELFNKYPLQDRQLLLQYYDEYWSNI